MNYMKKRLAIFLSVLIAFTTVFCVLPQEEVQAATTTYLYWGYYNQGFMVQKGVADFYVGDYIMAYASGTSYVTYGRLTNNKGVTYSSTNKSVATVGKDGKVTAKKVGTTTLKVKFKGKTETMPLKVVSSVASYKSKLTDVDKTAAGSKTFLKAYGSGITNKNRYAVLSAYNRRIDNGYSRASTSMTVTVNEKRYMVLCAPVQYHAAAYSDMVENYGAEKNPFGTKASKEFNIASISGKSKAITANLSKSVSADQIFGAIYANGWDTIVSEKKTVTFPVYVEDIKTGHVYYAIGSVTKGSKKMTITTKSLKMKKGNTYKLVNAPSVSWLTHGKITFKAK